MPHWFAQMPRWPVWMAHWPTQMSRVTSLDHLCVLKKGGFHQNWRQMLWLFCVILELGIFISCHNFTPQFLKKHLVCPASSIEKIPFKLPWHLCAKALLVCTNALLFWVKCPVGLRKCPVDLRECPVGTHGWPFDPRRYAPLVCLSAALLAWANASLAHVNGPLAHAETPHYITDHLCVLLSGFRQNQRRLTWLFHAIFELELFISRHNFIPQFLKKHLVCSASGVGRYC
jgi:hypothetical protein